MAKGTLIKSSVMLGLGENLDEVRQAFQDLIAVGCTHVTLGQYLRPTPAHLPVMEYLSPERFRVYEQLAYTMGFRWVMAGPFVRSSYHAIDALVAESQKPALAPLDILYHTDDERPSRRYGNGTMTRIESLTNI